jgi:iron(III) transport system permease protein
MKRSTSSAREKVLALRRPQHPQGRACSAEGLLAGSLTAVLVVLVMVPLLGVVLAAVRDRDGLGLDLLLKVLSSWRLMTNTLLVGTASTAIAIGIGAVLAIILVRLNTPTRAILSWLAVLPIYVTPLLTAMTWSWLGSPKGGLINRFARETLGLTLPIINTQSAGGVIVVTALACAPVPYLLISAALRNMDPELEDSARVHGATPLQAFARITLPLMLPAALGAGLLVLAQAIGMFSVPAVLGMPAGFYVATTEIYKLLDNFPPRIGEAAVWGMFLLLVSALLVSLQSRVLAGRGYVTITGKNFRPRIVNVGGLRFVLAAIAWLYVGLAILLPLVTLVWAASISFLTIDPKQAELTFKHFNYVIFQYPKTYLAAQNSMVVGALCASMVTALGLAIGWMVVRSRLALRHLLDHVSMFPLSTPAMVFALGLLAIYVGLKVLPIYGTLASVVIAHVAHYLPFGVRAATGAIRQLDRELEDASRVSGASWMQTMSRVTLPLTKPTLMAAWMLLFILSTQEISASILLYSSRSIVLSVAMFDLWESGSVNALAALGVLQLAVTFFLLVIAFGLQRQKAVA